MERWICRLIREEIRAATMGGLTMAIEFLDGEHMTRFLEAVAKLRYTPDSLPKDWAACLYILTAHRHLWARVSKYIDFDRHLVDFSKIRRKVDLAHGLRCMVDLAGNLYNGGKCSLSELIDVTDPRHFEIALRSIQIRRDGARILTLPA